MRPGRKSSVLISAIALFGCSDEITGTYSDKEGVTQYAFVADGEVKIHVLGAVVDAEYRLDNDRVLVSSPQGTVVLTLRDDRLYGPMGLELIRQSNGLQGE